MLILGCGYLGTALARAALADGEPAAALTRSAARAAELRALGPGSGGGGRHRGRRLARGAEPGGRGDYQLRGPRRAGRGGLPAFVHRGRQIHRCAGWSIPPRRAARRRGTWFSPVRRACIRRRMADGSPRMRAVDPAELGPAGMVLREAEKLFLGLPPRLVRRVWVLRLAGLYGPGRHHLLDAVRAGEKTFPGGGEHWVNLLHRDDAAARHSRLCRAPKPTVRGGIYNVADDEPVRKRELVAWLAGRLGQDAGRAAISMRQPRALTPSPQRGGKSSRPAGVQYASSKNSIGLESPISFLSRWLRRLIIGQYDQ